jgi:hypothetical protein
MDNSQKYNKILSLPVLFFQKKNIHPNSSLDSAIARMELFYNHPITSIFISLSFGFSLCSFQISLGPFVPSPRICSICVFGNRLVSGNIDLAASLHRPSSGFGPPESLPPLRASHLSDVRTSPCPAGGSSYGWPARR